MHPPTLRCRRKGNFLSVERSELGSAGLNFKFGEVHKEPQSWNCANSGPPGPAPPPGNFNFAEVHKKPQSWNYANSGPPTGARRFGRDDAFLKHLDTLTRELL
jgi:hypothetical protein